MKFTNIPDSLPYPPKVKATLSTLHSEVVSYVIRTYYEDIDYRKQIIRLMNYITAAVLAGDTVRLDTTLGFNDFCESVPKYSDIDFCSDLDDLYINPKTVEWDVEPAEPGKQEESAPAKVEESDMTFEEICAAAVKAAIPTPRSDLFLTWPVLPLKDLDHPVMEFTDPYTSIEYGLYPTYPLIPTKQREISATTDESKMSDRDILFLFPNRFIRTRADCMYTPVPGLEFDEKLGVIIPIEGFTTEQVRESIIKYPHIYKPDRFTGHNDETESFYNFIELDGELHHTLSIWKDLPESKLMPGTIEFIKEYVVRRYLLERDILGIEHKYPMRGSFEPFFTLFTTPEDYKEFGYPDPVVLGRTAVRARVSWWWTRNPTVHRYNKLKELKAI